MGWKNVKEHYRIGHIVQVCEDKIHIGSAYINDLIVVATDGTILKYDTGFRNEDLTRYVAEMEADSAKLRELIETPDTFGESVTVYTYTDGEIIEKQCESDRLGWPNVTHDGEIMYENRFSTDKNVVIAWAKKDLELAIKFAQERQDNLQKQLKENSQEMVKYVAASKRLEAAYP